MIHANLISDHLQALFPGILLLSILCLKSDRNSRHGATNAPVHLGRTYLKNLRADTSAQAEM